MVYLPPRRLMLSGGGVKGISYIGAFRALAALPPIKEYMGTSAGAFLGLCRVIGYTEDELEEIATRFDFQRLYTPDAEKLLDYAETFGIDDGADVRRFLESILRVKGFRADITFRELATATGLRFRAFAADLVEFRVRQFSAEHTPDVAVVVGVYASMLIPFYFTPMKDPITGNILVDGGILNNVPYDVLTPEEQRETLVLAFRQETLEQKTVATLADYIGHIYGCHYIDRYRRLEPFRGNVCFIPAGAIHWWQFHITDEQKQNLIQSGYDAVQAFFAEPLRWATAPSRRYSI